MKKPNYILGISAFYHDSAACLLKDGKIIAAAQEERFTRKKQDEDFPIEAVKYCLKEAGIGILDIDQVVFYEKPLLKFERLLQSYIKTWPWGFLSFVKAMKAWLGQKLWLEHIIKKVFLDEIKLQKKLDKKRDKETIKQLKEKIHELNFYYVPHHISHAASSFYTSGLNESIVLTVDGVGEWSTTTIGYGRSHTLKLDKEIVFPDSLGLLYSAFTYYLGFRVNSAEYKVMGLAPYGKPKYKDKIYEIMEVFEDGSFRLKSVYFSYEYGLRMVNKKFIKHFGQPVRKEDAELTQWHKDMAASLQVVTEELLIGLVKHAQTLYPNCKNLCLAGGVALNCVANGKLLNNKTLNLDNLYIFPAGGDAGGAAGAALYLNSLINNQGAKALETIYLGPEFTNTEIEALLLKHDIEFKKLKNTNRAKIIAQGIAENKVIGLFQGRMEFGPRALGNRSIIADPRQAENWQRVNLKVKFRESFRPFAPSVMAEKADAIFELKETSSPYMLLTTQVKAKNLPAITHVNKSARVQTVTKNQNARYHAIIDAFNGITGCPVLINTSFNIRGEPIVCSPLDALKGYLRTEIDVLVLEDYWIELDQEKKIEASSQFNFELFDKD